MYNRVLLGVLIALVGCGQKTYSTPVSARTAAGPEDAFACVKKQLGELGYKQTSIDVPEYRVNATKIDYKSRRADTQFRRMLNKIETDVAAEADGQTSIRAIGHTFAEYTTHRGPTEQEESPSELVKTDTKALLERCRS